MNWEQMVIDFDSPPARARRHDPDTAKAWADAQNTKGLTGKYDRQIVEALHNRGRHGATSLELAEITGIDRVCVSPRLRPLARVGVVVDTDERRNGGVVWKLPQFMGGDEND